MMEVGNFPHPVSVDNGGNLGYLLRVTFITWGKMGWTQFPEGDRNATPPDCSLLPFASSLLPPIASCLLPLAFLPPFPLAIT